MSELHWLRGWLEFGNSELPPKKVDAVLDDLIPALDQNKRIQELEAEQPPMSKARFRQEAVLMLWRDAYGTQEDAPGAIEEADKLTAAVFGEEVE